MPPTISAELLAHTGLSEAKSHLSEVMTSVVHEHRPLIIGRHRQRERMLLLNPEDFKPLLSHFRFSTKAAVDEGEWTLTCPELDLVAGGESFDEALDDLTLLAEEYVTDYFGRFDFFRQTDRAAHLPWLLRLSLADHRLRREMLVEPPAPRAA